MSAERKHQVAEPRSPPADQRAAEFLATLGHELVGPLGAVRNSIAILQRADMPDPTCRQACAIAERQTEHLVRLVESFLDLARLNHGKLKLDRSRLLMAAVIQQAVEINRPAIDSHRHRLTVVLPPVPLFVDGDFVRLTQVLSNVLHNAVKYTEHGGRIVVRLERIGDEAVLRVADSGIGIGPGVLPHVFERFSQAASGIGHRDGGLGLGLAVASRIVQGLGGRIEANSAGEHKGSEFIIRLPLAAHRTEASDSPDVSAARSAAPALTPSRRIVLVDDSLGAAESIAILGNLPGTEVNWTLDADTGLKLAGDLDPHVVVLDLESLNGEGYGFAHRLREQYGGKPIVVGMLTASRQEFDRQRAQQAGIDHCLSKPTDVHGWSALLAASRADRVAIRRDPAVDVAGS